MSLEHVSYIIEDLRELVKATFKQTSFTENLEAYTVNFNMANGFIVTYAALSLTRWSVARSGFIYAGGATLNEAVVNYNRKLEERKRAGLFEPIAVPTDTNKVEQLKAEVTRCFPTQPQRIVAEQLNDSYCCFEVGDMHVVSWEASSENVSGRWFVDHAKYTNQTYGTGHTLPEAMSAYNFCVQEMLNEMQKLILEIP
jgi:hypothetical protein